MSNIASMENMEAPSPQTVSVGKATLKPRYKAKPISLIQNFVGGSIHGRYTTALNFILTM